MLLLRLYALHSNQNDYGLGPIKCVCMRIRRDIYTSALRIVKCECTRALDR